MSRVRMSIDPRISKSHIALGVWLGCLATPACKDQEKCDSAVATTRQALSVENPESASQWREHTWQVCEDAALVATLDQEIQAKEEEIRKKLEEVAAATQTAAQARVERAHEIWANYDELDDKKKTKAKVARYARRARKTLRGLSTAPATQLKEYIDAAEEKRLKKASD